MTDSEFMDRAEALLARIESRCDRINDETEADIDNQRVGGMVTLTFPNGSQIIVNLQKPLHEIWMAARAGGFHYKFDGKRGWTPRAMASSSPTSRATPASRPASRWTSRRCRQRLVPEQVQDAAALVGRRMLRPVRRQAVRVHQALVLRRRGRFGAGDPKPFSAGRHAQAARRRGRGAYSS